jgi:hypothetical protein
VTRVPFGQLKEQTTGCPAGASEGTTSAGAKVKNSAEPSSESESESEWVLGATGIGSAQSATSTGPTFGGRINLLLE